MGAVTGMGDEGVPLGGRSGGRSGDSGGGGRSDDSGGGPAATSSAYLLRNQFGKTFDHIYINQQKQLQYQSTYRTDGATPPSAYARRWPQEKGTHRPDHHDLFLKPNNAVVN
ncbi:hypothetical protein VIGAN_09114500 [Vigna angularis var. angularis]|uniref:Uncharacterized protein n=1 Tax=Vigna angularis var. angularis TaxID=157739 RepID=A0A0S3SXV4_PHAAN|nr:hypothetical protein VIGAN_09114500 [Vigna angularis var. angularis]